ncbi:MAG TPA: hypothetical protein VKU94_02910, partial [Geobacterales bacterium]|nr:hypothetical protein [Geobacterales bacterium]
LTEEEKEKRRQEALAKAQARQNANKQDIRQESKNEPKNEESKEVVETITPAQMKAIENLVTIVCRAKGFDKEEYLNNLVAVHGADKLADLTTEQAKAVIQQINNDRK